jgi:hypothetical protein
MSASATNNVSSSITVVIIEKNYSDSSLFGYCTKSSSLELLDPEDEGTMISQHTGNDLPVDMT